jgi:pimeloyl-ACP methyl ester carboxylesterase
MEWMLKLLSLIVCATFLFWTGEKSSYASLNFNLFQWEQVPQNQSSLELTPVRETAVTEDGLHLGLKHFSNPGGDPILLLHGIATNDRQWDVNFPKNANFARFLHAQGYDVWIGNFRGFGTPGFRSEAPRSNKQWTVDHYAAFDIPAMVDLIERKTGKTIFVIAHSLGAFAVEGYLAGTSFGDEKQVHPQADLAASRQAKIRGIVFISGVHNFWWPKAFGNAISDPVRTLTDYYESNYELEFLTNLRSLYVFVPTSWSLPLGYLQTITTLPLDRIPFIGREIKSLYNGAIDLATNNPIMNAIYHIQNMDRETMRIFFTDGLESVPVTISEQLGHCVATHQTLSYYHVRQPNYRYHYGDVRRSLQIPILFVAGGFDRLTNAQMVYEDGYTQTGSRDKSWLLIDESGHEDILLGKKVLENTMIPISRWLDSRH